MGNAPIQIEYDARIKIIVHSICATVSAIVAAARLGLKSGLPTRVGADQMGRVIREQLEETG